MKRSIILVILFYCQPLTANCQLSSYWQQQVNYKIDVTLNDVDNSLDGFIRMQYYNNSPDTLRFIWIHLWPNAYKNDRTAFTDQTLENGSTDFYFSNNNKRGYINRLDFKVNGSTAKTEDHPLHQDIIKLILPEPLAPKANAKIETPFHVKLPYAFSRGGHIGQAYLVTQWYPKPSVYDSKGWHPIPYLDQGEFYSEFGNYEVQVTLPKNYVVAATGELQDENEKRSLLEKAGRQGLQFPVKGSNKKNSLKKAGMIASSTEIKTLHYKQDNVHDFAWFADTRFSVAHDTLKLSSGRIIDVFAYYYPVHAAVWKNSLAMIKTAVISKSKWLGEYPYNIVSVVDGGNGGGMEYPTITLLESGGSERSLDLVINHEVGHNWFYGILASNERTHPWMDEGMNTYYDSRYAQQQYGDPAIDKIHIRPAFLQRKMPDDITHTLLQTLINIKKDQPIETSSEKFNPVNYNLVAYTKTGDWMKRLEDELGKPLFDSCMHEYYRRWQFKHPYPEDFKELVEEITGRNMDAAFSLLNKKGNVDKQPTAKKDIRLTALFNLKDGNKHNYISVAPAIGYNFYDKKMLGLILHNYTLPFPRFQFVVVPLYASKSKQFNSIGRLGYSWYPGNKGQKAELSLSEQSFTLDTFTDSVLNIHYLRYTKVVPSFKYVFANKDPRSSISKYIQWKTFLIREQGFSFTRDTTLQLDIIAYPSTSRYINQLKFVLENHRVLYPYNGTLQFEQGGGFARIDLTGNYFFNYAKGGGLNARLFAGKFFYMGGTSSNDLYLDQYKLNMTGPNGYEDYTYSNYFFGRNEYARYPSQQIMMRDGAFKIRTDLAFNKIGKTDNWLSALNLTSTIPNEINPLSLLPFKLPIKAFLDIGTYAEAWQKNAETGRFIYDAGLQLSLFKNILNIYFPLLYSKAYANYLKSDVQDLIFLRSISFSIDIQNISLKKFIPQMPF